MFAVFLMAGVGFAAVAIDGGYLYSLKNKLQTTADAAALAAGRDAEELEDARTTALAMAATNMPASEHGAVLNAADVVTGSWNASTKTFTPGGTPVNALRVITRRSQVNGNPVELFFAQALGFSQTDVEVLAVVSWRDTPTCLLSLDPSAAMALDVSGGAKIIADDCGLYVNSDNDTALRTTGNNSSIDAGSNCVNGDYSAGGGGITAEPVIGCPQISDPLADLEPPPVGDCDYNNATYSSGSHTLTPGVYCGGITIKGGGSATLQPGIYILKDGKLKITGGGNLTGEGVTFYLTGSNAEIDVGGGGDIRLIAPSTGPTAGLIYYQDPVSSSGNTSKLSGNGSLYYEGVIYFPTQLADFSGGATVEVPPFTVVIANKINFSGGAEFFFNVDLDESDVPLPDGLAAQGPHLVQ